MPRRLPTSRTALLIKKFAQAINDVGEAYGRLQSDMVACMADAFQCERQITDVKKRLRETAVPVMDYIHDVAGSSSSTDELEKLAQLHSRGVLTDDEFATQKAKILP
ncbi:MAG: SHOCT domain-containing protein [Acidobacteria bacterium]|nr:SHOCT domain-containing protein [Acidobacteriota bacterium]